MQNNLYNTIYNPDVLSCIANLSNDEVFTPPNIANKMLDMLPQELFSDPNATFLDPACKSGVFLREIAKRLLKGLEKKIPNLQERTNHIFKKQLFGIAITELTSHLSRRSVYCSRPRTATTRSLISTRSTAISGSRRSNMFGTKENVSSAARQRKCTIAATSLSRMPTSLSTS